LGTAGAKRGLRGQDASPAVPGGGFAADFTAFAAAGARQTLNNLRSVAARIVQRRSAVPLIA